MINNNITVISDIHGRDFWWDRMKSNPNNKYIFLGDYWDSFDIPFLEQSTNFNAILKAKNDYPDRIVLLLGNHDLSYINSSKNVEGYQHNVAFHIKLLFEENKDLFQICHIEGEYLFSHAGVSHEFLENNGWLAFEDIDVFLNNLLKYKPNSFDFIPYTSEGVSDNYGDDTYQSPIWIRPGALIASNQHSSIPHKYIQIVGHTGVTTIDEEAKATNGRYYFVDIVNEYINIENGKICKLIAGLKQ